MVLDGLLSRVLSAPDSPTADLYFVNACPDFLDAGVERLAPTVFASPTTCLVMRHAMRAGPLPPRRRLVYLIDDDVAAGIADESLPYLYRRKLRMVEEPALRRFARRAGIAVVSAPGLARAFPPGLETHRLDPYWSERFAALDHFEGATAGWIDMAYLCSSVHRSDLGFLLPVIARLLVAEPRLRFHLAGRHWLPASLERHPRVIRIPGQGWTAYRRAIAARRFHVVLYPLLDTPFNRGRSVNKMIEIAVVGAAPVYSEGWRHAGPARKVGAALCLSNDPEIWFAGLADLIRDPAEMHRLAAAAQVLARQLNQPEPQRRLWRDLFGLREPALV